MDIKTTSVQPNTDLPVVLTADKNALDLTKNDSRKWLTWALISSIIALGMFTFLLYNLLNNNITTTGSNLGALSQSVNNSATSVLTAKDAQSVEQNITALDNSAKAIGSTVVDPAVATQNGKFVEDWAKNQQKVDFIIKNKDALSQMTGAIAQVADNTAEMQKKYRELVEKLIAVNAPSNQVAIANNQVWLAEKINNDIAQLQLGQTENATQLIQSIQQLGATIEAEQQGTTAIQQVTNPLAVQTLTQIKQLYDTKFKPSLDTMTKVADINSQLRQQALAVGEFGKQNSTLTATNVGADSSHNNLLYVFLPALLTLLGFLSALYFLYRQLQNRSVEQSKLSERETLRQRQEMEVESERARKIQEENERNQMAILRLLDELGDLAEGDLTVNATVSEDFTGAIADSVNFAIDQLRQLVSAINVTADRVARASDQTQATAVELAEASESQAQEIAGASAAINEMAVSIDQVSSNAAESASVADRSVEIAYNGAEVVQRTINGMNTIRDQIQETSKRIKRLGESSQEIGDIVGLINDIADQTNILALNAAIQASMAGEAGRGFAVVADEVQRLAERSATATKQIETLVKTIQADTNEAVMSMESTTAEVVRGAKLAKDAGEALEEVQTVSNNLAQLIQSISNAARQQAASAGHISNTMNIIQDITSQTTSGTLAAARSIGQLNEMAAALQESVSGFKLPEDEFMHA